MGDGRGGSGFWLNHKPIFNSNVSLELRFSDPQMQSKNVTC